LLTLLTGLWIMNSSSLLFFFLLTSWQPLQKMFYKFDTLIGICGLSVSLVSLSLLNYQEAGTLAFASNPSNPFMQDEKLLHFSHSNTSHLVQTCHCHCQYVCLVKVCVVREGDSLQVKSEFFSQSWHSTLNRTDI